MGRVDNRALRCVYQGSSWARMTDFWVINDARMFKLSHTLNFLQFYWVKVSKKSKQHKASVSSNKGSCQFAVSMEKIVGPPLQKARTRLLRGPDPERGIILWWHIQSRLSKRPHVPQSVTLQAK